MTPGVIVKPMMTESVEVSVYSTGLNLLVASKMKVPAAVASLGRSTNGQLASLVATQIPLPQAFPEHDLPSKVKEKPVFFLAQTL
jgi:hypothetical protein